MDLMDDSGLSFVHDRRIFALKRQMKSLPPEPIAVVQTPRMPPTRTAYTASTHVRHAAIDQATDRHSNLLITVRGQHCIKWAHKCFCVECAGYELSGGPYASHLHESSGNARPMQAV